jgi:hypothetical protein
MTTTHSPKDQSLARLSELADYVVPFTLRAICELRVADHLADGPLPAGELARLTDSHAPTLVRALRALAGRGVFTELEPEVFALTPLAEPLRSDHPASLRDAYPLLAPEIKAWAEFDHSLRTGEAAFDRAHGTGFWDYMAEHPEDNARFNASQEGVTRRELRAALPAYDWAAAGTVVDVGGGNGAFLSGILAEFPGLRGVVFDQPHVVAGAAPVLTARGVSQRCEVAGGSFLESVPAGGDVYVLKRVLYAWDDEHVTTVLRAIRAAMPTGGRVLIMEPVVEPGNTFDWGKLYDLLLVAMVGGGARGLDRWQALLKDADLELVRVIHTKMLPIIEARPR